MEERMNEIKEEKNHQQQQQRRRRKKIEFNLCHADLL
jgi:hypothetical protein